MTKYEIVSSTNPMFAVGMEIPLDIDNIQIGDEVQFLTDLCVCTQDKGAIMLNRANNPEDDTDFGAVYTLMAIPEVDTNPYPRKVTKETINDLRINKEIDFFFETKEIMISPTERLTQAHGITIEALYEFCKREWKMVNTMTDEPFPLELEENNNLILWNEWKFSKGSMLFLKEGSWNRKVTFEDGRVQIL